MDSSVSSYSSSSTSFDFNFSAPGSDHHRRFQNGESSPSSAMDHNGRDAPGDFRYVLEDVPHLTDYLPDLPVSL